MDVLGKLQKIGVVLDQHILISTLKKMAASIVSQIESFDVSRAKPLHASTQVGLIGSK